MLLTVRCASLMYLVAKMIRIWNKMSLKCQTWVWIFWRQNGHRSKNVSSIRGAESCITEVCMAIQKKRKGAIAHGGWEGGGWKFSSVHGDLKTAWNNFLDSFDFPSQVTEFFLGSSPVFQSGGAFFSRPKTFDRGEFARIGPSGRDHFPGVLDPRQMKILFAKWGGKVVPLLICHFFLSWKNAIIRA